MKTDGEIDRLERRDTEGEHPMLEGGEPEEPDHIRWRMLGCNLS